MKLPGLPIRLLAALAGAVSLGAAASAETVPVHVFDFDYSMESTGTPRDPTIYIGDTIHWQWDSGISFGHSVDSVSGSAEAFSSGGVFGAGHTFDHTFNSPGVFPYYCTLHGVDGGSTFSGMGGYITVRTAIAGWTFESQTIAITDATDAGPYTAEFGTLAAGSEARGHHAATATDWSSPAGNGSSKSFSSNTWGIGDYYQFKCATTGYQNIYFAYDQNRSGTGPTTFDLQYSLDGSSYTTIVAGYTVGAVTWSSGTFTSTSRFLPVALPSSFDNQAAVYFRLVNTVTPGGTAGTNRVDNIVISGTAIPSCDSPSISDQPDPVTADVGDTVVFQVAASGSGTLGYQWRMNGGDLSDGGSISGATTDTLTINPAALVDAGDYDCVVTNDCGGSTATSTSDSASLTVNEPACDAPSFSDQPDPVAADEGDSVSFTVGASGSGTLSYQWRKDGGDLSDGGSISGATTDTLTINPADPSDDGTYDCVVTNDCGFGTSSSTSDGASLSVTPCDGPLVTDDPDSVTTLTRGTTVLSVAASGTPTLTYQWRKGTVDLSDGGRISGATTDTLTISPTGYADEGSYDVVVSNGCGSATSAAATVTALCRPDCNGDKFLNVNDFICFKSQWDHRTAYGDYNKDGRWNINDFVAYQLDWAVVKDGGGCLN